MIAIDFINVFLYQNNADNFGARLFRLIAKADPDNMERLRSGFPQHVALYEWWMARPTPPYQHEIESKAEALEREEATNGRPNP